MRLSDVVNIVFITLACVVGAIFVANSDSHMRWLGWASVALFALAIPYEVWRIRKRALHNPRCSRGLNPPDSSSDLAM